MAKYIAMHALKKSSDEVMTVIAQASPEFARTMAANKAPAKCLKTWNPIPHGRTDYLICLWEADKAEDINISLAQV